MTVEAPTSTFNQAASVFLDSLRPPRQHSELDAARARVSAALQGEARDLHARTRRLGLNLLLGRTEFPDPSDCVSTIETVSPEELDVFIRDAWQPGHFTLASVSSEALDDQLERLRNKEDPVTTARQNAISQPAKAVRGGAATRSRWVVSMRPDDSAGSQALVSITWAIAPDRGHEDAAVDAANRVLGGTYASKLNLRLREDLGYTYHVRTEFGSLGDIKYIQAFGAFNAKQVADAIREFKRIVEVFAQRPLSAGDLQLARNSAAYYFAQAQQSSRDFAELVAAKAGAGEKLEAILSYGGLLQSLDDSEIQAARRILVPPTTVYVVVVAREEQLSKQLASLQAIVGFELETTGVPPDKSQ